MRLRASLMIGLTFIATGAAADVKIRIAKDSYAIRGTTGIELLESMQKRGPRHGLLARAIAQTTYKVGWNIDMDFADGFCRVKKADAELSLKYVYPAPKDRLDKDTRRRWQRFMKGVVKHEEEHGRIARDMVGSAQKQVLKLATRGDRSCGRTRAAVQTTVKKVYAAYEARQVAFDEQEHGGGGRVERLVNDLLD